MLGFPFGLPPTHPGTPSSAAAASAAASVSTRLPNFDEHRLALLRAKALAESAKLVGESDPRQYRTMAVQDLHHHQRGVGGAGVQQSIVGAAGLGGRGLGATLQPRAVGGGRYRSDEGTGSNSGGGAHPSRAAGGGGGFLE